MNERFFICDVFTSQRFAGNQLAVLPWAEGLSNSDMQRIAREFNFSETTFVLPPESGHTRRVRIFTPSREVPFAGHPNIGTAFVLASIGELDAAFDEGGSDAAASDVIFEEEAGLVEIHVERVGGGLITAELRSPQPVSLGAELTTAEAAAAVSLPASAVVDTTHPPQVASVGLPFVMIELADLAALERARADVGVLERLASHGLPPDVHCYVRLGDDEEGTAEIRARMFAPLDGVPEDPATGSANAALAGLLSGCRDEPDGGFRFDITQGVEMGRPSQLAARTEKVAGEVRGVWIGGPSVLVAEGRLHAPPSDGGGPA